MGDGRAQAALRRPPGLERVVGRARGIDRHVEVLDATATPRLRALDRCIGLQEHLVEADVSRGVVPDAGDPDARPDGDGTARPGHPDSGGEPEGARQGAHDRLGDRVDDRGGIRLAQKDGELVTTEAHDDGGRAGRHPDPLRDLDEEVIGSTPADPTVDVTEAVERDEQEGRSAGVVGELAGMREARDGCAERVAAEESRERVRAQEAATLVRARAHPAHVLGRKGAHTCMSARGRHS